MANKARDFVARFVSDLTKFRTDPAEKELRDLGDTADTEARGIDRAFDKVSRAAADTGKEMGRAGKETAKEAGTEVGAEFAQNIGSGLAAGDISTLAQDSAGGLVAAFAGIGGPIGIALAGVATVATGIFAGITASAAQMAADVEAAFQDIVSNADKQTRFENRLKEMFGTDSFTDALKQAEDLLDGTGVSLGELRQALTNSAGNVDPLLSKLSTVKDLHTVAANQALHQAEHLDTAGQKADQLQGKLTRERDVMKQSSQYARDLTNAMQETDDIATGMVKHGGSLAEVQKRMSTISQQLGAAGRVLNGQQPSDYASGGRS